MRRLFVVPFSLCLALSLASCGNGEPESALGIAVENQLLSEESNGQVTIDFDSLVEGDWTRLALVCGTSDATIADALGFAWEQPSESGVRMGFAYVFATSDRVEQFFGPVTVAPFDDRVYVSPCDWSEDDPVTLRLFERQDASIQYVLKDDAANALSEAWFPTSGQGIAYYNSPFE